MMKVRLLLILSSAFMTACTLMPATKKSATQPMNSVRLATLYDVAIYESSSKKRVSLQQTAKALRDADVVFIGEYHGNHASHWLQAQLQAALHTSQPKQILSLEQFSTDKQAELNQYLKGEIGEVALIKTASAWPNYKASYRPLVEFAKQHNSPVIAANAPADIVRCIGRQGESYLSKLKPERRKQLAKQAFLNDVDYQAAFQKVMHAPSGATSKAQSALSNSYLAQLSRDNTMAESIVKALKQNPDHQLIHMNGAFHSDNHLGTVALLKQRLPDIKIKVISPVRLNADKSKNIPYDKGDYVYLLKPLPDQYANDAERSAAFKSMFSQARRKVCE